MGSTKPGRNMYIGFGIQSEIDVDATNITYLQPTAVGGFFLKPKTITSDRRVGTRFKPSDYRGGVSVPFSFTVECNPGDCGRILYGAMGAEAGSVASSVYSHEFSVAEELPYCTVWLYAAGVADDSGTAKIIKVTNAKISKLSISGDVDGVVTMSVEGTGIAKAAATTPSATFTSDTPFFVKSVDGTLKVSIGDAIGSVVQFDETKSMSLDIDNGLIEDNRADDTTAPAAMAEGDSSISGSVNAVYNEDSYTEIEKFEGGDVRAFEFVFTTENIFNTSDKKTLTIAISQVRYDDDEPSYDPDVITVEMPFKIDVAEGFTITLEDDVATKYNAANTAIT